MTKLFIEKINNTPTPKYATRHSAGMDIHAVIVGAVNEISISPGQTSIVKTGLKVQPEPGFCVKLFPRSGLAAKLGLTLGNCVGLIDRDYEHEVTAILHNHGPDHVKIYDGERICQLKVERVEQVSIEVVDKLPPIDTDRTGGLGSTGS